MAQVSSHGPTCVGSRPEKEVVLRIICVYTAQPSLFTSTIPRARSCPRSDPSSGELDEPGTLLRECCFIEAPRVDTTFDLHLPMLDPPGSAS